MEDRFAKKLVITLQDGPLFLRLGTGEGISRFFSATESFALFSERNAIRFLLGVDGFGV